MRPSVAFSVLHCGSCLVAIGALSLFVGAPLLIPAVGASAHDFMLAGLIVVVYAAVACLTAGFDDPLWNARATPSMG